MQYKAVYDEKFLMHHGIIGQKWGKKNGPPYPLDEKTKAIAYRGGYDQEGNKKYDTDKKSVKQARDIVDRNLKFMSDKDLNAYKNRLILENSIEDITGKSWYKKEGRRARDNIIHMVGDASTQTGKNLISNVQMFGINSGLQKAGLSADVANILTKVDYKGKTPNKKKTLWERQQDEIDKNAEYYQHLKDMGVDPAVNMDYRDTKEYKDKYWNQVY